jgi:aconitate hydratase
MDARSIAATAMNGGVLTAATDIGYTCTVNKYIYDGSVYEKRCYNGFGKPAPSVGLRFGPNITDWPKFEKMEENILVRLCAVIRDEVTTTDELIPSGETSSYRSNPIALSEFTLSRRVPEYVAASKAVRAIEEMRRAAVESRHTVSSLAEVAQLLETVGGNITNTFIGSCLFAKKPGDGSAREQAASCQKVLGGLANICYEYATKRYRSNCINWGIIPFTVSNNEPFDYSAGDWIYVPGIRQAILSGVEVIPAKVITGDAVYDITLECRGLSTDERAILTEGCLMNYYAAHLPKVSGEKDES